MTSLSDLPEDIIFQVLAHLDTARDVAALSRLSHQWRALVRRDGWRIFVKRRFLPVLDVPDPPGAGPVATAGGDHTAIKRAALPATSWHVLADRLSWQDRSWDRRSFRVATLTEQHAGREPGRGGTRRRRPLGQSAAFQTMVAAGPTPDRGGQEQVVVLGAGENVSAMFGPRWRRRTCGYYDDDGDDDDRRSIDPPGQPDRWRHVPGAPLGFRAGIGDVTALSLIDPGGADPRVVVGRANGHLQLMSAREEEFGLPLLNLALPCPDGTAGSSSSSSSGTASPRPSAAAVSSLAAVFSVHWNSRQKLLLTGTKRSLWLHRPDAENAEEGSAPPVASHNLSLPGRPTAASAFDFVRAARFVNATTVACGLANSSEPLRWATLTESDFGDMRGVGDKDGVRAAWLDDRRARTVRAIEPVGTFSAASGNNHLALSAWDDGTIRLWDVRTPSPADAIYQDDFQRDQPANALLVYGATRFVAGIANADVILKVFDFRWPAKPYHHTAALPCGGDEPFPRPPFLTSTSRREPQDDSEGPVFDEAGFRRGHLSARHPVVSTCRPVPGYTCRWHRLASSHAYRPNATVLSAVPTTNWSDAPVYSLARADDAADALYAGVAGGAVELSLGADPRPEEEDRQREAAARATGAWRLCPGEFSLLESGLGLVAPGEGGKGGVNETQVSVPPLRNQRDWYTDDDWPDGPDLARGRLDWRLWMPSERPGLAGQI